MKKNINNKFYKVVSDYRCGYSVDLFTSLIVAVILYKFTSDVSHRYSFRKYSWFDRNLSFEIFSRGIDRNNGLELLLERYEKLLRNEVFSNYQFFNDRCLDSQNYPSNINDSLYEIINLLNEVFDFNYSMKDEVLLDLNCFFEFWNSFLHEGEEFFRYNKTYNLINKDFTTEGERLFSTIINGFFGEDISKIYTPVYLESNLYNILHKENQDLIFQMPARTLLGKDYYDQLKYFVSESFNSQKIEFTNGKGDFVICSSFSSNEAILANNIDEKWHVFFESKKEQSKEVESLLILLSSLNIGGKGGLLTDNKFFSLSSGNKKLIKFLVDSKCISGVVKVSALAFEDNSFDRYLLFFQNGKTCNNNILFADTTTFLEEFSETSTNNYVVEKLFKCNNSDEKRIAFISYDFVINNNYKLNVETYLFNYSEYFSTKQMKLLQPLTNLVKIPSFKKKVNISGKIINSSHLKESPYDDEIDIADIEYKDFRPGIVYTEVTEPVLLIALVGEQLKPTYCNASIEAPIYCHQDVKAVSVNTSIVYIKYLIYQMHQEYFLNSLKRIVQGVSFKRYLLSDILKMEVLMPEGNQKESFNLQRSQWDVSYRMYNEQLINKHQLKETIDAFLKEQLNQRQWQLHDLRNKQLLELKTKLMILNKVAGKNESLFKELKLLPKDESLYDYIDGLNDSMKSLATRIEEIWNPKVTKTDKKLISIFDFITAYKKKQRLLDPNLFIYDNSKINEFVTEFESEFSKVSSLKINFDKENLEQIFDNIFTNINKHAGFSLKNRHKNKVMFYLEVKNDYLLLTVLNTGNSVSISETSYFMDGGKAGINAGTGLGGYIIKRIAEENDTQVYLCDSKDVIGNEYVFGVGFKMKFVID